MNKLVTLALLVPLAACATIARGRSQSFTVETDPAGAHVETSNGLSCVATPCTFEHVKREARFTMTISRDGYRTQTVEVTHATSPTGAAAMAGTIALPGGLALSLIDANFGATQDLKPNPVHVTLEPSTAPAATATTSTH